jgi:hypothetical protein
VERGERIVDRESATLNFGRQVCNFFAGHDSGQRSTFKSPGQMIVSIVTRTVYGHKQFAGRDGARVDGNADQFGSGRKASGGRDTQGCSDLAGGPPHCVSDWLSV